MQKAKIKDEAQLEVITTDSETPIRCFISEDHSSYVPLHYHPAIELIYVLEGNVCFSVSNGSEEDQVLRQALAQDTLIPDPRINKLPIYQPIELPRYKFLQRAEIAGQTETIEQSSSVQAQDKAQEQEPNPAHSHKSFKVLGDLPEPLQGVLLEEKADINTSAQTNARESNKAKQASSKQEQTRASQFNVQIECLNLSENASGNKDSTKSNDDLVLSFEQRLEGTAYNCVIFNSDELHSTQCPNYNRCLVVQIPFDFLSKSLGISEGNKIYFALAGASETCLIKLQQALGKLVVLTQQEHYEQATFARKIHFQQALYTLLECLIEFMLIIPSSSRQSAENGKFKERVYLILDFIERHYAEEIYLQDVAQNLLHVHPNYLCRIFKKIVGRSFYAYLTEVRLSHVYQDLINTTEPITKIIERNGLTVNNNFYTLFRKRFGISPSELRHRHDQIEQTHRQVAQEGAK